MSIQTFHALAIDDLPSDVPDTFRVFGQNFKGLKEDAKWRRALDRGGKGRLFNREGREYSDGGLGKMSHQCRAASSSFLLIAWAAV